MDVQKIKELAEGYLDEQVELLKTFAAIDCESKDVEGNRKTVDVAEKVLRTIDGIKIEEMFFEGTGYQT